MEGTATPIKSGAAGAATFPGSDSRKFNYYDPKGRKSTHYEDMTLDVQPDPDRYLLQDWIINFPDGTPTYSKDWTRCKSVDWHKYRAVDQEWEKTHYQRQSTICGTVQSVIENGRRSGAAARFDKSWVKVLQDHLGAYKHAEFGLGTSLMQAQRYGFTQMINNAILTNSSYKLRFGQDLTLYLGEIGLDIEGGIDKDAGKKHWMEDPIWQGTRRAIEEIMASSDYLEQYIAINVVFEPLVGELFRSGFVLQMAAAHNDFITPSVVSAAEGDYERNLANCVELVHNLLNDQDYSLHNKVIIGEWVEKHAKLAHAAAAQLQPIWSLPRVKVASFPESFDLARNRFNNVLQQCGLPVPAVTA
ncbi:MAG: toluene hydroxylase [Hyphomicrobiaceae bacterium]|nr:toluene hydroxylase [Hyphomicrobiaceae bacterium]